MKNRLFSPFQAEMIKVLQPLEHSFGLASIVAGQQAFLAPEGLEVAAAQAQEQLR